MTPGGFFFNRFSFDPEGVDTVSDPFSNAVGDRCISPGCVDLSSVRLWVASTGCRVGTLSASAETELGLLGLESCKSLSSGLLKTINDGAGARVCSDKFSVFIESKSSIIGDIGCGTGCVGWSSARL